MLAAAIALCTWGPSGRKESTDERGDAREGWHLERSINGSQNIDVYERVVAAWVAGI